MYGAGIAFGDKMKVIAVKFTSCDGQISHDSTKKHPQLIGKVGTVVEIQDDRYDTEYPTGYERISITLDIDNQEHEIDSAYLRPA